MAGAIVKQEAVADLAVMDELWPLLPIETEIYLLPDGRVVIADMPVELADMVVQLGMLAQAPTVVPILPAVDEHD